MLEETACDPWRAMAVDAALLQQIGTGQRKQTLVRLYQWDRPSVSIGRLQPEAPVQHLYPDLPCVRRPTGGRAVLHGADLTVTVATLQEWLPAECGKTVMASYALLMAGIVTALNEAGHHVHYGRAKSREGRGCIHCFDLAAGCDLVDASSGKKVVGSAQRREGGAVLQQMSLPLSLILDRTSFLEALRRGFAQVLGIEEWLFVDTADTVCYTDYEESEGSQPWRAKF